MYRLEYRLKDKYKNLIGYRLLNLDKNTYIDISKDDAYRYIVDNATITKNNTYRALNGVVIRDLVCNNGVDIESRTQGSLVGKPSTLNNISGAKPSPKQLKLVQLMKNRSSIKLDKKSNNVKINMKDISVMTTLEDVEFALFERSDSYIIFKGDSKHIHITEEQLEALKNGKYKWIGHTHVGTSKFCLQASEGDYKMLRRLEQSASAIYNKLGENVPFNI